MAEFTTTLHNTIAGYTLTGASSALFAKVFKGHPSALMPTSGSPVARWYTSGTVDPPEGQRVLTGSRMATAVFVVQCYWPLAAVAGAQESQEDDIAEAMIGLPALLVAITPSTYTIAGKTVSVVTVDGQQSVNREYIFPNTDQEGVVLTITVQIGRAHV